jgi:hypothetical protein
VSFLLSRIPSCRTPIPRDLLTRVLVMNGSDLIGKSRIAISCCTISLPSKTPMNQPPKVPDPLPPVLADGRPGLILGVSGLMMSWFSWPRELRFSDASNADGARSLTPVPPMYGPDLIAVSGFRTSQFRNAKVSCPRNPRYAEFRLC